MKLVLQRGLFFLATLAASLWFRHAYLDPATPALWAVGIGHALSALVAASLAAFVVTALKVFFWQGYLDGVLKVRVPRLLPMTVEILIYAGIAISLLQQDYGVSLSAAIAASGAFAVVIGFALRGVILDLFSGLAISADRSYIVGDWITVQSTQFAQPVYGQVEEIDWRSTRLRLDNGTLFIIPNSLCGEAALTNHSKPRGPKRLEFPVVLPHEAPISRVQPLLLGAVVRAVTAPGYYADPAPRILVRGIVRDGVEYLVRFYADIHYHNPAVAISGIMEAVHAAVLANDLSFPGERVDIQRRSRMIARAAGERVDIDAALSRVPLLAHALTAAEITDLSARARRRSLSRGAALIHQGAEGDSLFLILSGAARVEHVASDGTAHRRATLSTGDVVGEMSLLTGRPRGANVIADTDLDVVEISRAHLLPVLQERPELAEDLSSLLAARDAAPTDGPAAVSPAGAPAANVSRHALGPAIRRFFGLH